MTDLPFDLDNYLDNYLDDDDDPSAIDDAYVLDESYWSVDGGGSPGNAEDGTYYLVRLKDRYCVFHHSGGEEPSGRHHRALQSSMFMRNTHDAREKRLSTISDEYSRCHGYRGICPRHDARGVCEDLVHAHDQFAGAERECTHHAFESLRRDDSCRSLRRHWVSTFVAVPAVRASLAKEYQGSRS